MPGSSLSDRYDASRVRAARNAYTSVSGHRSSSHGFQGMVEEMRWGLEHLSKEDRARADDRVLSAVFFGRVALATIRALRALAPERTARLFAQASPLALRWLVGSIDNIEPTVDLLPECSFRKAGGEALCERICRLPTERFCAENAVPVRLSPHPGSLACTWRWGSTAARGGEP